MTSTPKAISLRESGTGLPCSRVKQFRDCVDTLHDQIGGAMHDARALVRVECCPGREGGLCGGNGQIDIFSGSNRAVPTSSPVAGVADFGGLAVGCILPAAADIDCVPSRSPCLQPRQSAS